MSGMLASYSDYLILNNGSVKHADMVRTSKCKLSVLILFIIGIGRLLFNLTSTEPVIPLSCWPFD
jgi:hypothetical protein